MQIQKINTKEKVLIIAEIGNNHEGSYSLAEEMIGLAAEAGVDAVKFQTIIPERLVSVQQKERIKQLKKFQFSYDEFTKLSKVAKNEDIIFLSTPFDIDSVLFLNDIVPAFKIASGDNDFFPLIEVIAETGKPIIMSTGLANIDEIKKSSLFIREIWKRKRIKQELALLHCVSSYPTSPEDANLLAIRELEHVADVVGYSDHTLGINAAVFSVAVGARIIEKHFTIDNNYSDFHDHQLSANPKDFKEMVEKIRLAEKTLGSGIKKPSPEELENRIKIRRSIVAKHDFPTGHKISIDDLDWVRPGDGIRPGEENKVIGKTMKRAFIAGEKIELEFLT
jgi:N-acetylneuraminate synthase/N,N'-diacetyllegionaminate synthase